MVLGPACSTSWLWLIWPKEPLATFVFGAALFSKLNRLANSKRYPRPKRCCSSWPHCRRYHPGRRSNGRAQSFEPVIRRAGGSDRIQTPTLHQLVDRLGAAHFVIHKVGGRVVTHHDHEGEIFTRWRLNTVLECGGLT